VPSISFNIADYLNTSRKSAHEIIRDLNREEVQVAFSFHFDRDKAYRDVAPLIEKYLQIYACRINKKLVYKKDEKFFDFLLRPYFSYIICVAYTKYLYINERLRHVKRREDLYFPNVTCGAKRIFSRSEDFFNNIFLNPSFHEWLISIIGKEIGLKSVRGGANLCINTFQEHPKSFFQNMKESKVIKKPHRLYYLMKEFFHNKISEEYYPFKNIYGFGFFAESILSLILIIKTYFFKKIENPIIGCDIRRESVKGNVNLDPVFLKAIDKIIDRTFPKSFLENIAENMQRLRLLKKRNNSILFNSVSYCYDEKNLRYALLRERNCKIVYVQHGGGYATFMPYITCSGEYIADYFILWGSTHPPVQQCRFITLKSPLLSPLKDKHRFKTNSVIFVGHVINPLWDGILYPNPTNLRDYLLEKKVFFEVLSTEIFGKTFYKLHPATYYKDFNEKKFMSELFPNLKYIPATKSIDKKLVEAKILVMDHYSTTFYKAMVANTPVVIYFGLPSFKFLPEAQALFKKFKQVNIVFDQAEDAAKFINANWNNIETWWSSPDVQRVRKEFCEKYAQADRLCFFKWLWALINLKVENMA